MEAEVGRKAMGEERRTWDRRMESGEGREREWKSPSGIVFCDQGLSRDGDGSVVSN